MFALVNDLCAIADHDGRVIDANQSWERVLGWSREQLIGMRYQDLLHPDDAEGGTAEDDDGTMRFVKRCRANDGSYRSFEWIVERRGDEGRYYTIARDITERLEAERAVRESEAKYRLLIENLPDTVVLMADRAGRCTYVGGGGWPAALDRGTYVGKKLEDAFAIYGEQGADLCAKQRAALRGIKVSHDMHSEISGQTFRVITLPIRAAGNQVSGTVSFAANITDQVTRERQLLVERRKFEHAVENSPLGMATIALDGRFELANPALGRMLECAVDELLTLSWFEVIHPDHLEAGMKFIDDLCGGDGEAMTVHARYLRKDGSIICAEVTIMLVRDETGKPVNLVAQAQELPLDQQMEFTVLEQAGEPVQTLV